VLETAKGFGAGKLFWGKGRKKSKQTKLIL
jgi:hypothetical protein